MSLRSRHGTAANHGVGPVVEVPPADELGPGAQADPHADAREERDADGKWRKGARTAQAAGGRGTRQKLALSARLGLGDVMSLPSFEPFLRAARAFAKAERRRLRETVGGGTYSPAVDAVIGSAAWQKAASEFLFAQGALEGNPDLFTRAAKLANDSRQNLLAAHHLAELAAKASPKGPPPIWIPPAPATNDAEEDGPAPAEATDDANEGDTPADPEEPRS